MSTTIQIKRSSTASGVPLSTDLAVGELAVNLADKRLFTKQSDGTIIELSTNPTDLDAATLRIDGVEITASATELNKLDGFTGSTTELNILDGLTATTIELNTLDGITASTAELNKLDGYTGSTAELNILDGVTATTAELNYVDGVTSNIQTQLNNKQPLDAQLTDVAGLTPADGSFIVGNGTNFVTESGNTAIASLGVTATAAELNTLDGITSTTAELNILDGVTATATEINVLDGITATTTELNYTDGVTSNIQTQLDGKATSAQGALADSAVQPNDNVSFGTGSFSGEISANGGIALGDNDKATFGASDDLQIYSDGTNSIIKESGTGSLNYEATNINFKDATGTDFTARFITGGDVRLYHDGSQKLATTSTGVDVTGTVTADGLSVQTAQGNIYVRSDASAVDFLRDGTNYFRATGASGDFRFTTGNGGYGNVALSIDDNNDVYFFEDTGTTAKMVWDASAEGLELSSLTSYVVTNSGKAVGGLDIKGAYSGLNTYGAGISLGTGGTGRSAIAAVAQHASDNDANGLAFFIHGSSGSTADSSEAMRIDSSGNVGIGTASPGSALSVATNGGAWATSSSDGVGINYNSGNANISTYLDNSTLKIGAGVTQKNGLTIYGQTGGNRIQFDVAGSERARIDSSGNLLVGMTSYVTSSAGHYLGANGSLFSQASNLYAGTFSRIGNDGDIVRFRNDAVTTGSIGVDNTDNLYITGNAANHGGVMFGTNEMIPYQGDAITDGTMNIGQSAYRFKDLYLSGKVVNPSGDLSISCESASSDLILGTQRSMRFFEGGSEAARIDSSGNLLVGTTSSTLYESNSETGINLNTGGGLYVATNGTSLPNFNRVGSDGDIVRFRKDGSTVGSIKSAFGYTQIVGGSSSFGSGLAFYNAKVNPLGVSGAASDGGVDLGASDSRFKDLYLSGGVYLGGTGSANKLDDYETGTWTPRIEGSTTAGSFSSVFTAGEYVKVGRKVTCTFTFNGTSGTGAGELRLLGLPFSINFAESAGVVFANSGLVFNSGYIPVWIKHDGNSFKIRAMNPSGDNYQAVSYNTTMGYIRGNITYFTDQ